MEVDVPSSAALNILAEQEDWEKNRKRRSEQSYLHKRYTIIHYKDNDVYIVHVHIHTPITLTKNYPMYMYTTETSVKERSQQGTTRRRLTWSSFVVQVPQWGGVG